jgi:hypothetical protein
LFVEFLNKNKEKKLEGGKIKTYGSGSEPHKRCAPTRSLLATSGRARGTTLKRRVRTSIES